MGQIDKPLTPVSPECMDYMGIRSLFFKTEGGITEILQPVYFEMSNIVAICGSDSIRSGLLDFEMKDGSSHSVCVNAEPADGTGLPNCMTFIFKERLPEDIARQIMKVKRISIGSGKRSEQRFEVGLKDGRWRKFGLSSPSVVLSSTKCRAQGIIKNASIHGALLIGERSFLKSGASAELVCRFNESFLKIPATIVNIISMDGTGSSYYSYSLSFTEPLSLLWQRKVQEYAEAFNE